jgi:tRNA(Ile)-lysidine synthase
MALLTFLARLQKKYHWILTVAHVNYSLRGQDSDQDEQLVREQAASLGVSCHVQRVRASQKASEDHLRNVRYAFFETLREEIQADAVVLAHTQDDQAETLLLRLVRGTGSFGLQGMQPKRGQYVRPFLTVTRRDIMTFLAITATPYREDASNADSRFLRNRIRNELLPLLERHYNPNIRRVLATLAGTAAAEQLLLSHFGETLVKTTPHKSGITFSRKALLALSKPQQLLYLRAWCQKKAPQAPTKNRLEELQKTVVAKKERLYTIHFRGLKLEAKSDRMILLFE